MARGNTPKHDETAATSASTLITSWISKLGLPEHIISDRGDPFISGFLFNLTRYSVTSHDGLSPTINGLVE